MKYSDFIPGKCYRAIPSGFIEQDWIFKLDHITEEGRVKHIVAVNVPDRYRSFSTSGLFSNNWESIREATPEEVAFLEDCREHNKFLDFNLDKYKKEVIDTYDIF